MGKKHSPETVAKMRAAKLRWTPEMTEAALALRSQRVSLLITAERVGVSVKALTRHLSEIAAAQHVGSSPAMTAA